MSESVSNIELQGVTKRFGDRAPVLNGIDLNIQPGEFVSLIGPSGCGKSTLLRLLSGLTAPTAGRISIDGQSAETTTTERAFIFQDPTLLPWLDVRGNTETLLRLRHTPAARRNELAHQSLARVRIDHLANRYPRELSGGEKMRVSLARAFTLEPAVLLLDEPFAALDELTRERLNEELLAVRERQRWTAVFVTHSVAEAVFLSTRILVLAAGRIAHDISVDFPHPRTVALREDPQFLRQVADVSRRLRAVSA